MTRLIPIALLCLILPGCGCEMRFEVDSKPTEPPRKLREWTFAVDDWIPPTQLEFERMPDDMRMRSIRADRDAIGAAVKLPDNFGKLVVALRIRLRPRQHRKEGEAYWPALDRALQANGISATFAGAEYEEARGELRVTIELREVE